MLPPLAFSYNTTDSADSGPIIKVTFSNCSKMMVLAGKRLTILCLGNYSFFSGANVARS